MELLGEDSHKFDLLSNRRNKQEKVNPLGKEIYFLKSIWIVCENAKEMLNKMVLIVLSKNAVLYLSSILLTAPKFHFALMTSTFQ